MSGAITVNRSARPGQISDQSHELNGYPWIGQQYRGIAEWRAIDPIEDVESQVVEVSALSLPALEFAIHVRSLAWSAKP